MDFGIFLLNKDIENHKNGLYCSKVEIGSKFDSSSDFQMIEIDAFAVVLKICKREFRCLG